MVYVSRNIYYNFRNCIVHDLYLMFENNRLILNCVLVFSILSLSIAYFIQYILGHKPCNLCLIERIPYLASVILVSLIFIMNRFKKIIAGIILLFFLFGAVVSFYHVGIEQGIFSESLVCSLDISQDNFEMYGKSVIIKKNRIFWLVLMLFCCSYLIVRKVLV